MSYVTSLDEFYEEAISIFNENPFESRYVIKVRENKVTVKVSNNQKCVLYCTKKHSELNHIRNRFNFELIQSIVKDEDMDASRLTEDQQ